MACTCNFCPWECETSSHKHVIWLICWSFWYLYTEEWCCYTAITSNMDDLLIHVDNSIKLSILVGYENVKDILNMFPFQLQPHGCAHLWCAPVCISAYSHFLFLVMCRCIHGVSIGIRSNVISGKPQNNIRSNQYSNLSYHCVIR